MPKATAPKETFRYDLKNCPGGFVELRRMTYGEMIKRRNLGTDLKMRRENEMDVNISQTPVALYEFARSIVDHNLEDEDGNKLNMANAEHVLGLDSKIAGEIETLIAELNQPEEEMSPLPSTSGASSPPKGEPESPTLESSTPST